MMASAKKHPLETWPADAPGLDDRTTDRQGGTDDGPPVVLALSDLVADANGEVVLYNDSGLRSLALASNQNVVEEGEVGRYVTASGEDVSGFRFLRFDHGLRLFYQPGLDVLVVKEPRKG